MTSKWSYPVSFKYRGLKFQRFGQEIQIWKSLAIGSICSHTSEPKYPRKNAQNEEKKRAQN